MKSIINNGDDEENSELNVIDTSDGDEERDSEDGEDSTESSSDNESESSDRDAEADDDTNEPDSDSNSDRLLITDIYYDDSEMPNYTVRLWNTSEDMIDLSRWTVTTTEDGEYVFPEDTVLEGDYSRLIKFESDELTRDGGTVTVSDVEGDCVIEAEYGR